MSRWLVLQRQLRAVADLADTGNAELPQDHDEASLGLEDLISTAEAAEMLKVTEPQMRNLVSQFGGRRADRAWVSIGHWWSSRLNVVCQLRRLKQMPDKPPRKPAVDVRRLSVSIGDQLDQLSSEEALRELRHQSRRCRSCRAHRTDRRTTRSVDGGDGASSTARS